MNPAPWFAALVGLNLVQNHLLTPMFDAWKLRRQLAAARKVELDLIENAAANRTKREAALENLRRTLREAEAAAAKAQLLEAEAPARLAEIDRMEQELNQAVKR